MTAIYPVSSGIELTYARFLEDERIKLSGQQVTYYSINLSTNVDPLYNEPFNASDQAGWSFDATYTLVMAVEFQGHSSREEEASERGLETNYDATACLSYNEWQTNGGGGAKRSPKVGDVIECMGLHFDILKPGREGHLIDTTDAVGFKFELRRISKFDAGRKI